ncbi:hypothetical protein AgCh_011236 [Apium graveolens]
MNTRKKSRHIWSLSSQGCFVTDIQIGHSSFSPLNPRSCISNLLQQKKANVVVAVSKPWSFSPNLCW